MLPRVYVFFLQSALMVEKVRRFVGENIDSTGKNKNNPIVVF